MTRTPSNGPQVNIDQVNDQNSLQWATSQPTRSMVNDQSTPSNLPQVGGERLSDSVILRGRLGHPLGPY
eukprot:9492022-Pyramimonas_sp.AAC.2